MESVSSAGRGSLGANSGFWVLNQSVLCVYLCLMMQLSGARGKGLRGINICFDFLLLFCCHFTLLVEL